MIWDKNIFTDLPKTSISCNIDGGATGVTATLQFSLNPTPILTVYKTYSEWGASLAISPTRAPTVASESAQAVTLICACSMSSCEIVRQAPYRRGSTDDQFLVSRQIPIKLKIKLGNLDELSETRSLGQISQCTLMAATDLLSRPQRKISYQQVSPQLPSSRQQQV